MSTLSSNATLGMHFLVFVFVCVKYEGGGASRDGVCIKTV